MSTPITIDFLKECFASFENSEHIGTSESLLCKFQIRQELDHAIKLGYWPDSLRYTSDVLMNIGGFLPSHTDEGGQVVFSTISGTILRDKSGPTDIFRTYLRDITQEYKTKFTYLGKDKRFSYFTKYDHMDNTLTFMRCLGLDIIDLPPGVFFYNTPHHLKSRSA